MEQSVYSANETARIIGKQTVLDLVGRDAAAAADIDAIIDAHRAAGHSLANLQLALDLFALGLIYGKKIERARRNGGKVQPIAAPQVGGTTLTQILLELEAKPHLSRFMREVQRAQPTSEQLNSVIDMLRKAANKSE